MAIFINTAEGGTNAATATSGNTGGGSGNAFSTVNGAPTFDNTYKQHGSLSYLSDANDEYGNYTIAGDRIKIRMGIRPRQLSTADSVHIRVEAGGTMVAQLLRQGSGRFRLATKGNTNRWTQTAQHDINKFLRLEMVLRQGADATSGAIKIAVYDGDNLTAQEELALLTGIDLNGGVAALSALRVGLYGAAFTGGGAVNWDSLEARTESDFGANDNYIGPLVEKLATPVVTVLAANNPTTPGGTNGSIQVSWPAIPGADHYEAAVEDGTVTSGFVADDLNAVSPKTFTGLDQGPYTVAVRAIAP